MLFLRTSLLQLQNYKDRHRPVGSSHGSGHKLKIKFMESNNKNDLNCVKLNLGQFISWRLVWTSNMISFEFLLVDGADALDQN